jgi:riboflavin synthase
VFTGLVEETGTIVKVRRSGGSVIFSIRGRKTIPGLGIDHSIAIEGVCLTVIKRSGSVFDVQAVEETLRKTTLGRLTEGSRVNLERPLLPTGRLGGHFVLGHVDGIGRVESLVLKESSWLYWIRVPDRFAHHLIPVGSIAVNGVSLTMADVRASSFLVSIIPHTMDVTTFAAMKPGDNVNLEFDVLGKFVEQFMNARARATSRRSKGRKRQ